MSVTWHEILKFFDRTTNYQSWFIPLIWLYWPTKARKLENRTRKRAIDYLQRGSEVGRSVSCVTGGDSEGDFSDDGYTSLDGGESYLDGHDSNRRPSNNISGIAAANDGKLLNSTNNVEESTTYSSRVKAIIPSFGRKRSK